MELLRSLRRGNISFQNKTNFLFHYKCNGKFKDKEKDI